MIFKLAIKNLRKNPLMNLLTIIQLSVAFIILICYISTVVSRFSLYRPFADELDKKGTFHCILNGISPDTNTPIRTSGELADLIDGESEVIATFEPWLFYGEDDSPQNRISYDRKLIEKHTPELESGHWFSSMRTEGEAVQVVVSANNYGFKIGDIITMNCMETEIKAEIIGILKENTKLIGFNAPADGICGCRNIYENYSFYTEEAPLFIFCQDELVLTEAPIQLNGPVFVTYPNNTDNDIIKKNDELLSRMKPINSTPLDEMKSQTMKHIYERIYDLLPIFVCLLVITLVSATSTAALSAKRQLKNYAVFFICGLKWKQCALINMCSSLICALLSLVIGVCGASVLILKGVFSETVISLGIWQIIGCISAAAIYIIISAILPIIIIGKNPPRQVLKSN